MSNSKYLIPYDMVICQLEYLTMGITYFSNGYYVKIYNNYTDRIYFFDISISKLIDIDINLYQKTLIDKFNAELNNTNIVFKNERDCINACEWIQSVIITNELVGDKNV